MRPTVLIADDHQLFAESLASLLADTFQIVGIATDGRQLIEMAILHTPRIILTDLSMPQLNGLDALQSLVERGMRSKFVVLTMHADVSLAVRMFRAGASGFLLKTVHADELKKALQIVNDGGCYLSSQFPCDLVTVLANAAHRPHSDRALKLTRRQREVLQLVAEGRTMKEVADSLSISTRTAESYKYQLMNVLGIHTNAELVQHAIKIGLITVNPFETMHLGVSN